MVRSMEYYIIAITTRSTLPEMEVSVKVLSIGQIDLFKFIFI